MYIHKVVLDELNTIAFVNSTSTYGKSRVTHFFYDKGRIRSIKTLISVKE